METAEEIQIGGGESPMELAFVVGAQIGYALSLIAQIKDRKRREELDRVLRDIYDYVYKLVASCKSG